MDYFTSREGHLFAEDVPLSALAEKWGTPLYVYSRATLARHCGELKKALAGQPAICCFAVKANGNLSLLKAIFSHDFGADVVSVGELERALAAGADPRQIVYSGVGKRDDEIARALGADILSFNVESLSEVRRISSLAVRAGKVAPISLRVNPNIDAKTHPHISTGLYSTKFGIAETDLAEALDVVRQSPGVRLVGLACHIGSQILESGPFQMAAERMANLCLTLKQTGFALELLNLGGGIGIRYAEEDPVPLQTYASLVAGHVAKTGLKLVVEPGRVIVGNAGALLTRVTCVKKTPHKTFVVVDAGMNDLIRPSLYEAFHAIEPVEEKNAPTAIVDVVGPICETGDFLALGRELPVPAEGDLLLVRSAGAYGMSMASHYNSRPNPAEVLVEGANSKLIRRRETLEDLWKLEQGL